MLKLFDKQFLLVLDWCIWKNLEFLISKSFKALSWKSNWPLIGGNGSKSLLVAAKYLDEPCCFLIFFAFIGCFWLNGSNVRGKSVVGSISYWSFNSLMLFGILKWLHEIRFLFFFTFPSCTTIVNKKLNN